MDDTRIEAENLVPALKPDGQIQFLRAQVRFQNLEKLGLDEVNKEDVRCYSDDAIEMQCCLEGT